MGGRLGLHQSLTICTTLGIYLWEGEMARCLSGARLDLYPLVSRVDRRFGGQEHAKLHCL
jgi:hypothetical protein